MKPNWLVLGGISAVLAIVYAFDRRNFRRAKSVVESWNCFRCGVQLDHMSSTFIPVAGGPTLTTKARACPRCSRRDARIRNLTWVALGVMFVVAIVLLRLR